jgi:hypothetical protein
MSKLTSSIQEQEVAVDVTEFPALYKSITTGNIYLMLSSTEGVLVGEGGGDVYHSVGHHHTSLDITKGKVYKGSITLTQE